MREPEYAAASAARESRPTPLKEAMRQARIEAAERTGVVVDLRDAALARLEMLSDELDPVFEELPAGVTVFDRGLSRGDTPRLWIDMVARVEMGRDKRLYRFLQDTRYGPRVLGESPQLDEMTKIVTAYMARRLVEREQALSTEAVPIYRDARATGPAGWPSRWRNTAVFLAGVLLGAAGLMAAAWFLDPLMY